MSDSKFYVSFNHDCSEQQQIFRLRVEEENLKLAYDHLRELLYQYHGTDKENIKLAHIRLQESEFWALKKTLPEV